MLAGLIPTFDSKPFFRRRFRPAADRLARFGVRARESTVRKKRQEGFVWMARKLTKWPSKRGPITKIMPSDGCERDTVPLAVGRWYDFHEFGCHLGNVGCLDRRSENNTIVNGNCASCGLHENRFL